MAEQRPLTMDPPHLTEFASDRYFEKLNQLKAQQQQHEPQQQSDQSQDALHNNGHGSSTFILPLREFKAAEVDLSKPTEHKRDKGRLHRIWHKKKSLPVEPESVPLPQARLSTDSTKKSIPFDHLFQSLPNELQIQVIASLPLTDILNLRLSSKSWHALITFNEMPIVRYHLDHHIPAYAVRLYPITGNHDLNFHYLCSLWHRLHVAAKLAFLMCEWITKDLWLRTTEEQRRIFAPQNERMRRRLIPVLFTVFHFFETYRKLHLEYLAEHDGVGLRRDPYTINPIEAKIFSMYDDRTLLRVHEAFPLIVSSFCRRLRPPTYVGRVERSLRGYIREKPSDDVHVAILCIGGLRQVERLWEMKGYNNRRSAVDTWYNALTKEISAEPPAPTKSRRSLLSFGRKKSIGGEREHRTSFSDHVNGGRSPSASMDDGYDPWWVFNTSLSAGVPMSRLSRANAQSIMDDLPVLQQIWTVTAEATILDRGIVERPQDIKRNQAFMLELIREDGIDGEDEWLYGRSAPASVRPVVTGDDDDGF